MKQRERTLLLVKPDGVTRGLIGECIGRFEQRGFAICALKMIYATREQMSKHYLANAQNTEWLVRVGKNTLESYEASGKDPQKELGTADPEKVGKLNIDWLVDFMTTGPIVAIVASGIGAVEMGRKIAGHTLPSRADIGSIRGDYSIDTPLLAALEKRPVKNIIHASGAVDEAEYEIACWFQKEELCTGA